MGRLSSLSGRFGFGAQGLRFELRRLSLGLSLKISFLSGKSLLRVASVRPTGFGTKIGVSYMLISAAKLGFTIEKTLLTQIRSYEFKHLYPQLNFRGSIGFHRA